VPKVATLSTESIASSSRSLGAAESCAACGAALAPDQRYCLECGERRTPMSSVLLGGVPARVDSQPTPPPAPPPAPGGPARQVPSPRGNTVTVIAGVGVLLLAMGVGVLIGRSGGSKAPASAPQVITVANAPGASSAGAAAATPLSDDWPAGTSGYTVQLQTLTQASTQVSAVEAAKAAAIAKGAKGVGALKSEDFSSLTSGNYVIYSGVDHTKAEAEKALRGLKKSFPGASVVKVSNASATAAEGGSGSGGSGAGSSQAHPAGSSVLKNLKKGPGNYEQKSKNLPNVIETG
jgi:hypothetical protein